MTSRSPFWPLEEDCMCILNSLSNAELAQANARGNERQLLRTLYLDEILFRREICGEQTS